MMSKKSKNMEKIVNIIGAGLAGSEAAYYLLNKGVKVNLYEMKPIKFSPAHKNEGFAELVCSNSLKSNLSHTAEGLLKDELRELNSFLIKVADSTKVPSGSCLAVDRESFSKAITEKLKSFKNLNIINKEICEIPNDYPTIIATGPLTSDKLLENISKELGSKNLYFFDAISPIVNFETIDFKIAFFQDRYEKGEPDYINCPMSEEDYQNFHNELINAKTVQLKEFENNYFQGCMPIEALAKRGKDTMRFGPLKPVGIFDYNTNSQPYAVVQLRKETKNLDMFNIVGFQTNLIFSEQKRVFRMIPGLKDVEFYRYGTMHRNAFINAPTCLNKYLQIKNKSDIFIAGQLSGVEGYVESIASGLIAAINMHRKLENLDLILPERCTMIGALMEYISTDNIKFQPMSANMGLVNVNGIKNKNKNEKNKILAKQSIFAIKKFAKII